MLYHFILIQLFCNRMDYSPPGPSVHGIPQARILEWVAIFPSRGSSQPRDWTHLSWCHLHWQASSLPLALPRKPYYRYNYYFNSYIFKVLGEENIFTSCTLRRVVTSFICFSFIHFHCSVLCSMSWGLEAWKLHFPATPTVFLAGFLFLQWDVLESYKVKGHKIYFFCFSLVGYALGTPRSMDSRFLLWR